MADFIDEDLSGSRFERVDLTGARFERVDLTGLEFRSSTSSTPGSATST